MTWLKDLKMNYKFYYIRFIRYKNKYGIVNSFKRIGEKLYQSIFQRDDYVFYSDLALLKEQIINLPERISVEQIERREQINEIYFMSLSNHIGEEILSIQLKNRFSVSATLWIIKAGEDLAGYVWSIGKSKFGPYYMPIGENDVFIFDGAVLEKYRGKNIFPMLLSTVLFTLKEYGVNRAIVDAHEWNVSVHKSFFKVGAKILGIVRKYKIGNNAYLIWKG
jgi:GNAT superfamily N-acetyltransferase